MTILITSEEPSSYSFVSQAQRSYFSNEAAETDFLIANYGGMMALSPMSEKANKACDDGVIDFEDWQVLGGSIIVDRRMAQDLIEHLREDGFTVAEE